VLFLNYCLSKLKPGGRMAIVLPQGNFNNISAEQIRRYVMSRARILAVVGLDVNTFKPHTGTKTSVLFVQRWAGEEAAAWAAWYDDLYRHEAALAEYEALAAWRGQLLGDGTPEAELPAQICEPPPHPGDPPPPPEDYPIFFATSRRSGRDNSGRYDYLKDGNGQVVLAPKLVLAHDEQGQPVEVTQDRPVLDTDLDQITEAFVAWAQEHNLDFFAPSPSGGPTFAEVVAGADFDISSAWISQLERTWRLDAEFYRPRFLALEQQLDAVVGVRPLAELCNITDGNHFAISDHFMSEGIYRYLRGQDLSDFFLQRADESPVYIPEEVFRELESSHMYPLDVLLSIVGTIGAVGIIPPDWPVVTGSCKLAVLRAKTIDPYYLAAFWAGRYGQFQAERNTRGTVQMGLVLDDLPHLRVYTPSSDVQAEVSTLVQKAYESISESKHLYRQAEQLLLDELGLHTLELPDALHHKANLADTLVAQRLDTDYFEKRYDILLERLAQYEPKSVSEVANLRQERFAPQSYVPFEYIEISDVNLSNGLCTSKQLPGEEAPDRAQQMVHASDIVVSTVRPLRGGTALIRPEQDGFVCSSGFAVLQPTEVCAEYLLTYLRLKPIRGLINRDNRASMYPAVTTQDILKIPIVVLPNIEDRIQARIRQSHQAYYDALALLEQAKCKVETMIEDETAND
jgi:restriction endonuclease S subunit